MATQKESWKCSYLRKNGEEIEEGEEIEREQDRGRGSRKERTTKIKRDEIDGEQRRNEKMQRGKWKLRENRREKSRRKGEREHVR